MAILRGVKGRAVALAASMGDDDGIAGTGGHQNGVTALVGTTASMGDDDGIAGTGGHQNEGPNKQFCVLIVAVTSQCVDRVINAQAVLFFGFIQLFKRHIAFNA